MEPVTLGNETLKMGNYDLGRMRSKSSLEFIRPL